MPHKLYGDNSVDRVLTHILERKGLCFHSVRQRMGLVEMTLVICKGSVPENFHVYQKCVKQEMH
jgi:hypothetical protein